METYRLYSKFIVIVIATLGLTFLGSFGSPGGQAAETQYEIEVKLLDEERTLRGKERVSFTNYLDRSVSQVVFSLRGNLLRESNPYLSKVNLDSSYPDGFDPGWTKISKVTGPDGEELNYATESLPPFSQTYSLKDTILRIELPNQLKPGESTSLVIDFSTRVPRKKIGDEEYYRGVYTWRFGWYPTLTPAEWWTGYDREVYSEIKMPNADYEVGLNLPEEFQVAGIRANEKERRPSSNRKLVEFELDNARSFPLAASSNYRSYREEFKEYTIEVLHFPGYQEDARVLSSYANEILGYYAQNFGYYKRKKLTFTQNPVSGFFGMAADGVISLGNSFFAEKDLALSNITNRLTEYIVAHEIAHQWFGIGVGANLNSQNWISEAFAEYLSLQYFHHKYPENKPNLFVFERDGIIRNTIESQLGYINLRDHTFELPYIVNYQQGFDEAIIKPFEDVRYYNAYQTRIYKKGYMVLRTLEGIIGVEEMHHFVRDIYENYDSKTVDVALLEEKAREIEGGKIPDDFFQEWLFTSGYVNYGVNGLSSTKQGDGYSSEVIVTKSGSLDAPVTLRATLSSGKEVEKTVSLSEGREVVTWETEERIKKVTIDPDNYVLDTNRLNNHFPRKVDVSLGDNGLPLDAYFILVGPGTITGRTPNRYVWSIGPGFAQGRLNLNRNVSLNGGISLKGNSLSEMNVNGWVESRFDFWSNPKTGTSSQYWSQNKSLSLGLERFTDSEDGTYNLIEIGGEISKAVRDNWSIGLDSSFSLSGDARFSISARETERIFPNIYLNLASNLGFGLGDLPPALKFDLTELKSYGEWRSSSTGNIGWRRYSYPGNYKLFSRISFDFPISRKDQTFVGNLALISRIDQSFFLSGGATWDDLQGISLDDFKYEVGGKLTFQGKTLGGLMPFDLAIGYAYHGQDKGRPFFNFSLGF